MSKIDRRKPSELLAVIEFRGDKLYNEHIYSDHASMLVQLGLREPSRLPTARIEGATNQARTLLPCDSEIRDIETCEF